MKGLSKTLTASSLSTVIFIYVQQPDKFYITSQPTTTSLTCGEHLSTSDKCLLDSLTYMAAICLNDAGIMHFIPAFVRETTDRAWSPKSVSLVKPTMQPWDPRPLPINYSKIFNIQSLADFMLYEGDWDTIYEAIGLMKDGKGPCAHDE
jgi:hypothetical protein